jgi:tetratricopeptide (TPR) repeat protein
MSVIKTAKGLVDEAKKAYQEGENIRAAQEFQAAAEAYFTEGEKVKAAEMLNNSSVSYLLADDAASALKAVEGTPQIFADAGEVRLQAMALGNYASALEGLERLEEAMQVYNQSAELLQQAGEDEMRVKVMQSLSALQLRTGRRLEALVTMQAGLEGIKHPNPKQRLLKRLLDIPSRILNK